MSMPGFSAEMSLYRTNGQYVSAGNWGVGSYGTVLPQACACTRCVQIGRGRWCVTIPVINRRVCVNVPSFGSWRVCGCVRFGWPPFTFNLQRC